LDDILDLSRIESGQLRLERIPFDLRFVIEDCVRSLQVEARQKGLTLASVLGTGVPGQLVGDPLRLRQILQNLLSNALKFTEHGSICVTVERQGLDYGSDVELKLTVADTGIGIPVAMQGRIFERYLPSQEGGPASGRGFGLPITRRLAELFGGRIWVESEVGQGSRFHVTLRFEAASEALPLTRMGDWMTTGQRGRRRILVAEDNLVNQKVVTAILAKRGYEIEIVANGVSAIEKLAQAPFDLVLMDIHMPLMDGLEAVKKIRANPKWRNLPVLALTGDGLPANREKCLLAGMTGLIVKPMRPSVLVQTIELFLNGEENESPESRDARLLDAQMNLLEGMVVLFLQLAPERMERIGAAMGQHDFVTLSREAYRLRNAAERISAADVVQTARQVEEAAKHFDIDLAQRSLVALCREIGRMSKSVKPEFV
jgi:CheY-like chemotaxis protein